MDMREYIAEQLDNMHPGSEKDTLREYMERIFIPLYDHVEGQYAKLEERVKDEKPLSASKFAVWTTIMEREKANGGCPYLFPMLDEDISIPMSDLSEIQQSIGNGKEVRADTVFLEADYMQYKQLCGSREVFCGTLKTEGREYPIGVRLVPAKRYISRIESLYRLFISNAIQWQTVNSPYLFKMFDVIIVRLESDESLSGRADSVAVNYGDLESRIRRGFIPVWNIQKMRIKSEDFPLAALDKVNYEYAFDLAEYGTEHGYLADYDSSDIAAVRREENTLIVTSPSPKGIVWDMYKVAKKEDYVTDQFRYELMNNTQADSFAGRMISAYGVMIKTKGELIRVLNSYDASRFVQLDSFQIVTGKTSGETYEVNVFLADEVRDLAVGKSMVLRFKQMTRNHFLARDEMSFLTSQVQLIYPEFHCVGVLL